MYGWTDSMVTLAWLKGHPSMWNVYVANRVFQVQTRVFTVKWNHVKSCDNPTDCATRGLSASALVKHELWWSGPPWLRRLSAAWPIHAKQEEHGETTREKIQSEVRKGTACHVQSNTDEDLVNEFSTWTKLIRVTARIKRFVDNLKRRLAKQPIVLTPLTATKINEVSSFWLHLVQQNHFAIELKALTDGKQIIKSSPLYKMNPFIGKDSLLRLGGRLENASFTFNERHPVILPKHRVSELLIQQAHQATLHGGTQLTLRVVRQRYWILSARTLTRAIIHRCDACTRARAKTANQLMGNLLRPRVTPSAPFTHTGVDYASPINLTKFVGRGQRARKTYVIVFICLSTKAIHLESVHDYSTNGFLAAFKRFVSRRGLPSDLYSDNGTNFQGADRELRQTFRKLSKDPLIETALANDCITWHFIPPASPHFGGLWKAGVKSFKHHLKRVMSSHNLSQVEFETLLCQIEVCLNSRPIAALTDDPTDVSALTPGHFLIGCPLMCQPEQSVLDVDQNRLTRWQQVQAMQEQIWRSWSADYLHTLHQRNKWTTTSPEFKIDELVLLKTHQLPPSQWELARIVKVHPGADNHVRVVTVRTAKTELKRPITQICRLPHLKDTSLE